jgi:hypothetical protein
MSVSLKNSTHPAVNISMQSLEQYLAAALLHGTRRKFSRLTADYLEEKQTMSTNKTSCTTTGLAVGDNEANRTPIGRAVPNDPQSLAAVAPARLPSEASSDSINSGFSVTSQIPAPTAKCVDADHLEGSNKGDHRAPANTSDLTAFAKNSPGPREAVGQFQNSRNDKGAPFVSTGSGSDSDAGD